MTRRERLEAKADKREEWAEGRRTKASKAFRQAEGLVESIPMGQPILVGHHSEKRHRKTIERAHNAMGRGVESATMAEKHDAKAAELRRMIDKSIFSDDPDALEALGDKVEALEAKRDRMKAINAAWRTAGKPAANDTEGWTKVAEILVVERTDLDRVRLSMARDYLERAPFPSYVLQNLGAVIRNAKQRATGIETANARLAATEVAGGVLVETIGEEGTYAYCRVTFAERPDRDVLDRLRAAGFHWSRPSWIGKRANLPEDLT